MNDHKARRRVRSIAAYKLMLKVVGNCNYFIPRYGMTRVDDARASKILKACLDAVIEAEDAEADAQTVWNKARIEIRSTFDEIRAETRREIGREL